jgi:hypothetical protein
LRNVPDVSLDAGSNLHKGNTYLENFSSISKNILFVNNGGGPATIGH